LKRKLESEISAKQHREEYDSLSKIILELPSRSETQKLAIHYLIQSWDYLPIFFLVLHRREIEELSLEINALEEEDRQIEETVNTRSKQFQLVLFAVNELGASFGLEPEDPSRERKRKTPPVDMDSDNGKEESVKRRKV
jgi:hypothetical protein